MQGKRHLVMEAESGVMYLPVKECRGLLEGARTGSPLEPPERKLVLLNPDLDF